MFFKLFKKTEQNKIFLNKIKMVLLVFYNYFNLPAGGRMCEIH